MKTILICLIRLYRRFISPLKAPCCRFYPTCSAYALESIRRFGAIKGTCLAASRILRCHPFSRGGKDLVPGEFHFKQIFWRR